MIKMYFDGSCEPVNPGGNIACGVVIYEHDAIIHEISKPYLPRDKSIVTTNNIAEYCALIFGLIWLMNHHDINKEIYVFGDSQLVIRQMSGDWDINKGSYVRYAEFAKNLLPLFSNLQFEWIARERNTHADRLSRGCHG